MLTSEPTSKPSSSCSSTNKYQYDVFLSFRGVDTRLTFISHLHKALLDANLTTFQDDAEIKTGEFLKPELENAIKSSRASVIVLSKNYASSTWCLEELVSILHQKRNFEQVVLPIFYHVEPADVRKQQKSFREAMEKHTLRMEEETDTEKKSLLAQKIDLWTKALTEVADLKGKDVNDRLEAEFIEEIVKDIYGRLGTPLRITLPLLVGKNDSVKIIISWLKDESSHTGDVLTILGMGGIGKTTLAKYIYGLNCHKYTHSFVYDIGRRSAHFNGLLDVQKQLCDDITAKSSIHVHDVSIYTSKIENALARKKVLLVLDDVDSIDQLDALFGKLGFHAGSKIIITTKDASLTERCALFKTKVKPKYMEHTLEGLSVDASMELLGHHAFTSNCPNEDYKEVSRRLARYCEGHPLALEVLGKSLHNRGVREWEDIIGRLKKEPDFHIERVLKVSFDSLPSENDKNLFKHIACFFVGMDRDVTETILDACDINTRSGINNLIDRCLISLGCGCIHKLIGCNNKLVMHQLLQDMGKDLARKEGKPRKRSRIWCHEESFNVLKHKKGTENIVGLDLDTRMLKEDRSFELNTDALSKMDSLMLLRLNYVQMKGSYENFPNELRCLCMHGSLLKYMPPDLRMENLAVLDMSYSKIQSFGIDYNKVQPPVKRHNQLIRSGSKDNRLLRSLKILVMSFCEQLHTLHGFYEFPLLERLIISNCTSLTQICESISYCDKLFVIDMSNCKKLKKLPRAIWMLKKVKTILSIGCDLSIFPTELRDMDSLQTLVADNSCIEVIPDDLRSFMNNLPVSLVHLSLKNNNLSNESFPMDFSSLSLLKTLYLDNNPIVSMPSCVRTLGRLEILSMRNCKKLETVEHPPSALRELNVGVPFQPGVPYKLRAIIFDPMMSPLSLVLGRPLLFEGSSFVIEGMVKIQPLKHVDDEVLCSLGWVDLPKLRTNHLKIPATQMNYEFGIFSTIYWGKKMPSWISCRSKGSSVSITIPSSPNKLRGLNFCYVHDCLLLIVEIPMIVIRNITKNRTWIYIYCSNRFTEKSLIYLSHWMFGRNEMEDGDQVTISVEYRRRKCAKYTECGVGLVFDDERMKEDILGYYKSWNHIIGGDLSAFETTTGEYILLNIFFITRLQIFRYLRHLVTEGGRPKGEKIRFRAFSQQKYDGLCGSPMVEQFPEVEGSPSNVCMDLEVEGSPSNVCMDPEVEGSPSNVCMENKNTNDSHTPVIPIPFPPPCPTMFHFGISSHPSRLTPGQLWFWKKLVGMGSKSLL